MAGPSVSTRPSSNSSAGTAPLELIAEIVGAARGLLGFEIDLFDGEGQSGLHEHDARGEGAGAGAEIELHADSFGG